MLVDETVQKSLIECLSRRYLANLQEGAVGVSSLRRLFEDMLRWSLKEVAETGLKTNETQY